jgi:hypothetical protein
MKMCVVGVEIKFHMWNSSFSALAFHRVPHVELAAFTVSPAIFLRRVDGHPMIDPGIFRSNAEVIDCSLRPQHHEIAVIIADGELNFKKSSESKSTAKSSRTRLSPYPLDEYTKVEIQGVVRCNTNRHRERQKKVHSSS